MAIRFDLDKFQIIKQAFIEYATSGKCSIDMLQNFSAYKPYLDADKDLQNKLREIKYQKDAERSRVEKQKQEALKRLEEEKEAKKNDVKMFSPAKVTHISTKDEKAAKKISKQKSKKEKQRIISQIQTLRNKLKSNIKYIDECKKYLRTIPTEYTDELHTYIEHLTRDIKEKQSIINVREFIVELILMENELDDAVFNKKVDDIRNTLVSSGLTDEEREIVKKQINRSISSRKKIKALRYNTITKANGLKSSLKEKGYEEVIILWSNINFGNNVIRITDENGKFLLAPKEICRKSYNQIKEYLADKLPQIILVKNQSGVWMLKEPIVFKNALNMIRRKESEDLLQEAQYKEALHSYSSMESYLSSQQNQELILKRLREKKQNYLNHLIKNQIAEYKLVPAVEMIAYESAESVGEEDVFIFTIQNSNYRYRLSDCVNIVYENVNPARASIVFTVEKRYYNQALQSIFNFMNDAKQKNKRSKLRQVVSLNSYIKNLHVVNHYDDIHEWAVAIKR